MPLYSHSDYTLNLPEKHSFPMERYEDVARALEQDLKMPVRRDPRLATLAEVHQVHCPEFVSRFCSGGMDTAEERAVGFPWSPELVRRTFRICGATLAATEDVLMNDYPVAGNLSGGTHHAFAAQAEGYCVFNDIAVAARMAQRKFMVPQVIVIDLDVHQGNGTASIFSGDPSVFTLSVHAEKNYPWEATPKRPGSRFLGDLDLGVPDDVSGDSYLQTVEKGLATVEARVLEDHFSCEYAVPPLVFFQAGVDPLKEDRLGRLGLDRSVMQARNALVYSWCKSHDMPLVITMGGGYSRPIQHSVDAHCDVFMQAAAVLLDHNFD
jgi:acetoin utilization deacetylase AcuC-like enzyme